MANNHNLTKEEHQGFYQLYQVHTSLIDHLHASPKEFISKLIAVTSWLDAVVAYKNVLYPMEN